MHDLPHTAPAHPATDPFAEESEDFTLPAVLGPRLLTVVAVASAALAVAVYRRVRPPCPQG